MMGVRARVAASATEKYIHLEALFTWERLDVLTRLGLVLPSEGLRRRSGQIRC